MGLLITNAAFTGKFSVAHDTTSNTKIDAYIARYEEDYLRKLLGVTLFNLFKTNYQAGPPPTGVYLTIFNAFAQDHSGCVIESKGMADMITGFLWWEYVKDLKRRINLSGISADKSENSREMTFDEADISSIYNESKKTWDAIQWYITQNKTDYPDYNGQCIGLVHWAL